jgi:ParB-like chromosome segregation protein Spo0J
VSDTRSAGTVMTVPVGELLPGVSPRIHGEDAEHVRILTESQDELPPIVVHRTTMRVIDGMHRLRAAIACGQQAIAVEYFEGSEVDAFLHSVRANVTHGLPLSRHDRKAAVKRIIRMHSGLSDRAIAAVVGLSPSTVGTIRRSAAAGDPQPNARVGRDGRVRPLTAVDGRLRVREIISARPEASLREIAREANVSISTARDVRQRVHRGEDPVPGRSARVDPPVPSPRRPKEPVHLDRSASTLDVLRRDPSLRFTEAGRMLLQWMGVRAIFDEPERVVNAVPEYCTEITVALARRCAEAWTRLGNDLQKRARDAAVPGGHGSAEPSAKRGTR